MTFFRGADEIVIGKIHVSGQIAEVLRYLIGKCLRINAFGRSRFIDFLTVFISTGQEHHIKTVKALKAGQYVTCQGGIGMANMWLVIDVIDRCRDVIGLFVPGHGRKSFAQVVKQNGPIGP